MDDYLREESILHTLRTSCAKISTHLLIEKIKCQKQQENQMPMQHLHLGYIKHFIFSIVHIL